MASSMLPDPWDTPKPGNPIPQNKGILSPEMKKLVTNQQSVNVSAIRSDLLRVERKRDAVDGQTTAVISQQSGVLENFNKNIIALRVDVNKLGRGLDGISRLIFQQNQLEIDRIRKEQEELRLSAERATRSGRENAIEQRVNNALLVPVQAITPKLASLFDRIKQALAILFGGWLTNQLIELLQANQEDNVEGVKKISENIQKNILKLIGGLVAVGAGFKILKGVIGNTARGLTSLFISRPLAAATRGLGRALNNPRLANTRAPKPNFRPTGLTGLSRVMAALDVFLNLKNGEFTDATIAALAVKAPNRVIRTMAGAGFIADQIAEMFGFNLFGKNPREEVDNRPNETFLKNIVTETQILKEEEQENNSQTSSEPQEPQPEASTGAAVEPQETKVTEISSADIVQPQETITGQPVNQPEQQQSPAPVAQPMETITGQSTVSPQETEQVEVAEAMSPGSPEPSVQSPAKVEISPVAMTPQRVGEVPAARPEVALIRTSSPAQGPQTKPPVSEGELNPVPKIGSSNPDNFHRLYSELVYNVVV